MNFFEKAILLSFIGGVLACYVCAMCCVIFGILILASVLFGVV